MRRLAFSAALALAACSSAPRPFPPARFEVVVPADAPMGVSRAAEDLVARIGEMGVPTTLVPGTATTDLRCQDGVGRIVLRGDALGPWVGEALPTDQTFAMRETRCDGGTVVELAGGGLLGRQYAAYEFLHLLGVRFFHPEETFVPSRLTWPAAPIARVHTPSFRWRSVSLHLTHPLELGDPFRNGTSIEEGVRYIDWTIANGASRGIGGVSDGVYAEYGITRGLPRETGINLHEVQQGDRPVIDPDDPRPVAEQIAEAVDEAMGSDPTRYPQFFGFNFNPSEFTELPDTQIVEELTILTNYITERYPNTVVSTINHGTHGPPTENYGVRFYDLPQFAPTELGVMVHTLMFYDLERPAPVYGNDDFHFLYDFIAQEAPRRRIRYFPEAAYWLTFDIAVPLYLPITIEARDRDIQRLRPLLQTDWSSDHGVDGHHTFGSGHEWGYWQNEYCSLRMSMDVEYRYRDCLADIAQPLGPAAASEVVTIIDELITLEARDLMTGWEDTLAYLVGTDPETEIAASVGVVFHPLPPTPATMMTWDLETIRAWRARHEPALMRMDTEYGALAARLEALTPMVAAEGRPIFDEILDGVSVTGLRARHAWQAYGAVAAKREADLTNDAALATTAHDRLEAAMATTARARQIIARRESEYRYAPLSRSIAGGEDFDEDQNWTVYRYRYLARTHWAYYWTRVDRSVDEVLTGGSSAVRIADVMLEPGRDLSIEVLEAELAMVSIDFGDGSPTSSERSVTHAYASPDVYSLAISATRGTDTFSLAGDVAELTSELHTAFTGRVVEPAGVALIEGVLPALVIGSIDATRSAVGFSAKATGEVELGLFTVVAPDTTSTAHLATLPARFDVPIVNRGTGTVSASILVEDGVVTQQTPTSPIVLAGQLSTDAVVEAVVSIGAFDRDGARRILASTLGYTPSTLPASVAFRVEFEMP